MVLSSVDVCDLMIELVCAGCPDRETCVDDETADIDFHHQLMTCIRMDVKVRKQDFEAVVVDILDSVFDQQFKDDSGNLDLERSIRYLKYGLAPVRDPNFTKGTCRDCGNGAHFGWKQEEGKRVWICLVCGTEYDGYMCEGCGSPMNRGEEIRSDGDPLYCKICYDGFSEKEKEETFSNYREAMMDEVFETEI